MSNLRLNAEKKIENSYFNLKLGTTNRINPQAIYLEGNAFITPLEDSEDFNEDIYRIKYCLKKLIAKILNNNTIFENRYILNFDLASNGIKFGKKSYLSFQIIVKQKNNNILSLKDLYNVTRCQFANLMDAFYDNMISNNFTTFKSKKAAA